MNRRLTGTLALALVSLVGPGWAAEGGDILITGDHVEYHEAEQRVIGYGHLAATYQDSRITCDRAVIYLATKDAFLTGRVRLHQPDGDLTGEEVLYNFETRKGTVLQAEGEAGPWRTVGDRVDKTADSGAVARRGYVTLCEFEAPHTRLQSREIRIVPGDRVIIRHAVIYVGPVPVLYLPSYTHRLDDRRPRVTLTPGKSKDWGVFLLTAWRLYLHENLQARVLVDYRERRDLAWGVDAPYRIPEDHEGILRYYYTHERKLGRKHLASSDDNPTVERQRYRLQLRHRWEMDPRTTGSLELHRISDGRFLHDISIREFEQDTAPASFAQIVHSAPRFSATVLAQKRVNRWQGATDKFPSLRFDVRPTAIPWRRPWAALIPWGEEPLELLRAQSETSRFYYESRAFYESLYDQPTLHGNQGQVRRAETRHQLTYQAQWFHSLSVTPLIATQQTWFSRTLRGQDVIRGAMETGVDLSMKFFRVFDVDSNVAGLELHRLRHVITPTAGYRYSPRPTIPPAQLVGFASDNLDRRHVVTPGLEQKLQTKRPAIKRTEGGDWVRGDLESVDLVRWITSTDYPLRGENDSGGQLGDLNTTLECRPYSWLLAEHHQTLLTHRHRLSTADVDLVASPGISSRAIGVNQTRIAESLEATGQERPWLAAVGWRWQDDVRTQLTMELAGSPTPKWRIGLYERMDLKKVVSSSSKFLYRPAESELRIQRDLHEWTVELLMNRRRADGNTFLLIFRLKAFPEQPLEFERHYNAPKLQQRRPLYAG